MIVVTQTVGPLLENSYFYIDKATRHGFLIDPGDEAGKLLQIIRQNNWIIEKILLTHGHFDHLGAVQKIVSELKIPYFIYKDGQQMLENPELNLSVYTGNPLHLSDAEYLSDGELICLKASPQTCLKVIHTPGHTPCSVIFYDADNGVVFSGDTLFNNGFGATHFIGGDYNLLWQSLSQRVFTLPNQTTVYPGHGGSTDIGSEKTRYI